MTAQYARVCALTGSTGFLGSLLRHRLGAAGWRVVGLTRRRSRDADDIQWSLESPTSIVDELRARGIGALIHAAWDFTQISTRDIERVNVAGSRRLLEDCCNSGVQRRLFVSTISAFPGARSQYGRAKLAVEREFGAQRGIVLRPGLIYGESCGGMFGALRDQIKRRSLVPMVGDGSYPQYLVHQDDLSAVIVRLLELQQDFAAPLTIAHPNPIPLRVLLAAIAEREHRQPRCVPIPWRLVYAGLRVTELMGLGLGFRSDSVMSLVHQDPAPRLTDLSSLGLSLRAFVE